MPKKPGNGGGNGGGGNGGGEPAVGRYIAGTDRSDRLNGDSGDDTIYGGLGDDNINGRDGFDVAVYDGIMSDFHVRTTQQGGYWVTDENTADGDEGRDDLKNVEQLQFSDYSYNLNGDNPTVIEIESTTIYATAGEDVTFDILAYDVDDSVYISVADPGDEVGRIRIFQPYWVIEDIGFGGDRVEATMTIDGTAHGGATIEEFARAHLAEGETETVTITFQAGSSHDGHTTQSVDIVYTGVNDAPTLAAISAISLAEDGGPVSLDIAPFANDVDSDDDATSLSYTILSAPVELDVSFDGTVLTVDPGAGFQNLSADEFVEFTIEVQATDRHGATTEVRTIDVRLDGINDPTTVFATPDGKPDYAAIGLSPFDTPDLGVLNAYSDDPAYLDIFAFTDGDDTIAVQADDLIGFESDTFFFSNVPTTNYDSFPLDTGAGDDTLLIGLTGDGVEFQFNDIITGDGRDVVVVDVQTPFGIESFGNSISTGANDDQVFINIDTPGIIQFASNDVSTGSGNDVVHVEVRTTRDDGGDSALAPFRNNDFSLGSGDDRLTIDIEIPNGIDVGINGTINAGAGDDVVEISNAGSSLSDNAFSSFRTLGLDSTINLGDGADTFIFDVRAFDGEGAVARINGGEYWGETDGGIDTVMLMTGNIADFDVTKTGDDDWLIVQGGQTLVLSDIENVIALDGSISDLYA